MIIEIKVASRRCIFNGTGGREMRDSAIRLLGDPIISVGVKHRSAMQHSPLLQYGARKN
jgi:hypothetical protein